MSAHARVKRRAGVWVVCQGKSVRPATRFEVRLCLRLKAEKKWAKELHSQLRELALEHYR